MKSLQQWKQPKLNVEIIPTNVGKDTSSEDFIASRLSESPTGRIGSWSQS